MSLNVRDGFVNFGQVFRNGRMIFQNVLVNGLEEPAFCKKSIF